MEDETEDRKASRFACLELASRVTKFNDDSIVIPLDADEIVLAAEKFFTFINKKEPH